MRALIRVLAGAAGAAVALAGCSSSTSGSGAGHPSSSTAVSPSASAPPSSAGPTVAVSTAAAPGSSGPATSAAPPTVTVSSAKPTHATLSQCTGAQLTIGGHFDEGGSAAGHERAILTFTNTSATTCTLYDYPGVDGTPPYPGPGQIEHFARSLRGMEGGLPDGSDVKPTLVLHHGTTVSAVIEASSVPQGSFTDCTPFQNLKVTAPNTTVTVTVPINQLPSCNPQVHPVVAGSTG
jgi:hypothetical protein